ncbi:MAG TPA: hypothetical protein VFO57_01815 [Burkholderiales bacterium]|nr:hypothetical protein [Burkholderiales bacterium]
MSPDLYAKVTGGIWGFILGAGIAMIIGFQVAGWSTSTASQKMSDQAVLASYASICVAQFMSAPNQKAKAREFQGTESYLRSDYIEKGGWDRMPGQEKAAWGVSSACVAAIEAQRTPGA